jgi:hypothetical protein
MFSGGDYEEVGRWLRNFLTSHAKRENPRAETLLDSGDDREGKSYGARFQLGDRVSTMVEFDFREVADHRGALSWCTALAERARAQVRELVRASTSPVGLGRE